MSATPDPFSVGLDKNAANFVPLSPLGFMRRSAAVYPDRTAVIHSERCYTWRQTYDRVRRLASALIAHGKALFAPHQVGRGLTVLNMGSMGGTFLAQTTSGFVIGLFPTTPDGAYDLAAYRLVFGLQAAFILLACLFYFGSRDPMEKRASSAPRA